MTDEEKEKIIIETIKDGDLTHQELLDHLYHEMGLRPTDKNNKQQESKNESII